MSWTIQITHRVSLVPISSQLTLIVSTQTWEEEGKHAYKTKECLARNEHIFPQLSLCMEKNVSRLVHSATCCSEEKAGRDPSNQAEASEISTHSGFVIGLVT